MEIVSSILAQFGPEIASIVVASIITIMTYAIKKLRDFVDAKVENENLNNAIDTVTEIAETSIKSTVNRLENQIKKALKDGELSEAERSRIKDQGIASVKSKLTSNARKRLGNVVGDVEGYIGEKVESVLQDQEKN